MPFRILARKLLPRTPVPEAAAGLLAVVVGIGLMATKFLAYYLTGSAAIFSDAMESIVNVMASCFALYALYYAHRPADREHPYGHGKIEFMSAGFEGGMIFLAAMVIAFRAVETMIRGVDVQQLDWGLALMAGAMLVNGAVGMLLIRLGKKHQSITLEADGHHLISDAVTSLAALFALGLIRFTGWQWLDPVAAMLMAVYITLVSFRLLRRSAAGLLDEQDVEDERLLRQILDSHLAPSGKQPQIQSYHKLRHRHSGRYHWVDFHILVAAEMTIEQGHAIASSIEYEIECALGEGNATAHVEPWPQNDVRGTTEAQLPQQAT